MSGADIQTEKSVRYQLPFFVAMFFTLGYDKYNHLQKESGFMNETERKEQSEYERRRAARRAAIRRKKRKREMRLRFLLILCCMIIPLIAGSQVLRFLKSRRSQPVVKKTAPPERIVDTPPDYDVQLLSINEYSRPGLELEQVNGIVVHYTANPGTTAQQNRDYFESLSQTGETSASSHFVIGIDGELIQCIPCQEIAYASNERNGDTIAIECCIPDETGKFADATYDTLIHLLAWLAGRYHLGTEDIIRHYDVTGKECPKYYVEYPLEWESLKEDVHNYIESYGVLKTPGETEETQQKTGE